VVDGVARVTDPVEILVFLPWVVIGRAVVTGVRDGVGVCIDTAL